jgi:hypothetical protein
MFKLLSGKAPTALREWVIRTSEASDRQLRGSFTGTHYFVAHQSVDLSEAPARQQFAANFISMWSRLSRDRTKWIKDLSELEGEFGQPETPVGLAAAFSVLCGVVKTDEVCRVACEYPRDLTLVDFAYRTLAVNMATLDTILDDGKERHPFDPTPSVELLRELKYSSRLFDLKLQQSR